MANKAVLFLVVGILIGAAIGAAAGFVLTNNSKDTTYWYYIDYSDPAVDNQWISAKSDNAFDGFTKALDDNKIEYVLSGTMITSINGVEPDYFADGKSWGSWLWTIESNNPSLWAWQPTAGLDLTIGSVFYIGVTAFDPVTYAPTLKPDNLTAWKTGGPFAK
jgi:hypothetical protein